MAGPENDPVKQNPQAPKEPTPTGAPANKYVGTPAVGTSKAAAAAGDCRGRSGQLGGRSTPPSPGMDRHHGLPGRVVPGILPFFSATHVV